MDYETLHLVGIVSLCIAIMCLIIACIIFFKFKILIVIGNLNGKNAKRAIKRMKENKGKTATIMETSNSAINSDILKTEKIVGNPKASTSAETVLLESCKTTVLRNVEDISFNNNETEELNKCTDRGESKNNIFDVEVDEVIIHTSEVIN